MSVLAPEVHTALATLLQGLQSPDNVQRTAAEQQLNDEWVAQRPEVLLMGLSEQIELAQDTSVSYSFALIPPNPDSCAKCRREPSPPSSSGDSHPSPVRALQARPPTSF